MTLVLGTSNKNKVREILDITGLDASYVTTPSRLNIQEEPVEDGQTFLANAVIKAMFYHEKSGLPVLAEDTGLEVFALGGRPGLNSARFAGTGHNDAENRKKLVSLVMGLKDRSARFVCHAVLAVPLNLDIDFLPPKVKELPSQNGVRLFYASGEVRGEIVTREAGQGGFGYDPIFFLPEMNMTFAQVEQAYKNSVSHRAHAMRHILPLLNRCLTG